MSSVASGSLFMAQSWTTKSHVSIGFANTRNLIPNEDYF